MKRIYWNPTVDVYYHPLWNGKIFDSKPAQYETPHGRRIIPFCSLASRFLEMFFFSIVEIWTIFTPTFDLKYCHGHSGTKETSTKWSKNKNEHSKHFLEIFEWMTKFAMFSLVVNIWNLEIRKLYLIWVCNECTNKTIIYVHVQFCTRIH